MKKKRNAIIMAAGMATRFVPLCLEKPKSLWKVNGEVLLERQIRQLQEAGIEEIVLTVGYRKEQFLYLKEKYGVIIIENPYYEERNNHSSLYVAREYLGDTYICSSDNYFHHNVFKEKSEVPYYASVYVEGATEEWCFGTKEDGRIEQVTVGGKDSWIMKGHAYFTKEFSDFLKPFLVEAMDRDDAKGMYWEDVYMEHIKETDMYIKKYEHCMLEEFDSLQELRKFDPEFINHSGCRMIEDLCLRLQCTEDELYDFMPDKIKERVIGFTFLLRGKKYKYELGKGFV